MKLFTRLIMAVCLLATSMSAQAGIDHLLPKPQQVTTQSGPGFALGGSLRLADGAGYESLCPLLREFLDENAITIDNASPRQLVLTPAAERATFDYNLKGFENEGYTLTVSENTIEIEYLAGNTAAVSRAAATLLQLAEGVTEIPAVEITDYPAFKLRGFMHDVGRSFITVEELKNEIRKYARFKVNCFHWHLTENQAWRFEVKAYPQLTSDASMTRYAGQYYTQEQCREIDQLCKDYGMVLIPEIDMPGHSQAFTRAMGHSMQTDQGVAELKTILEEVADVFTNAPYIHIGADEQTITYTNFLQTMIDKLHSLGKYCMVWNPISGVNVAGLDVEMCQLWSTSGKKISGKANIDCRYNYSNHFDVFADLAGIYLSQIYYQDRGDEEIAGEISCPWNDRKTPTQEDIIKQNNVWANTIASASRAWIGGGEGYIETQGAVLPNSGLQYEDFADWEARFLHWKKAWLADEPIPYVKQANIRWRLTDYMPNNSNASTVLPPESELADSYVYNGTTYNTRIVTGGGVYLRHTWGGTVPCVFGNPSTGNTAYAWTYVYSPVAQEAGALIEFQNYGRSEKDPAPAAGQWDMKGSRVWLNDVEITAPNWKNAGVSIDNEVDLQDENFTAREPITVTLKEGWNKVFLKLPYVSSSCRLNKWMWTFVLTDKEGKNAIDGLIYSPAQSMDSEADNLMMLISELETKVNGMVGDEVGYYSQATATDIRLVIEEVKETLSQSLTEAQRAKQKSDLLDAYQAFVNSLTEDSINMPVASVGNNEVFYTLMSLRGSRYALDNGAGKEVSSTQTPVEESCWKFVERTDGDYDIISGRGLYLSPDAANNTVVKTVTAQPSAGWKLVLSSEMPYMNIVSGSVQINQTNNSSSYGGYKVYNWGDGTNRTDEGCKYRIAEAAVKFPVTTPNISTASRAYYYNMYTPNRSSRYVTSRGAGAGIYGDAAPTDASAWKFVDRGDGTLDIVNYDDKSYISPDAAYNNQLVTSATQPAAGWTITPISGTKYVTFTSGTSVQFNQTNAGLSYKLYNWGYSGSINTTDTGCQYIIVEADQHEDIADSISAATPWSQDKAAVAYDLQGRVAAPRRPGLYIVNNRKVIIK